MNRAVFFLAAILSAAVCCAQSPSAAVPDASVRRFEIGGQFTDLILGTQGESTVPKFAFGPTFAFNLNRHLAFDASYLVMNTPSCLFTQCSGGRASVLVAGARIAARDKYVTWYAYARPGVLHYTAWSVTEPYYLTTITVSSPAVSHFVSNFGDGVGYALTRRIRARAEVGDLMELQTCPKCNTWTNHLQISIGMDAMVGKPLPGTRFDTASGPSHRFLDKTNLFLLSVSLLAQAADAVTTQHVIGHGYSEADALVRPLVNQGWPGQIGGAVIENAGQIFIMYRLHKMGFHRAERLVPIADLVPHAYLGYHTAENYYH